MHEISFFKLYVFRNTNAKNHNQMHPSSVIPPPSWNGHVIRQVSQIWDKNANTHASMKEVFDRSQSICWARTTMLLKKKMKTQITSGTKRVQKIIGFVGRSSKLFCINLFKICVSAHQREGRARKRGGEYLCVVARPTSFTPIPPFPSRSVTTPATHARYVIKI